MGWTVLWTSLCLYTFCTALDTQLQATLDNELPSLYFTPYVPEESYRSVQDIEQRNFTDAGMDMVYASVNWFLLRLSKPFRHYYLLSNNELVDGEKFLRSLERNYVQWIDYDQGFLLTASICLLLCALFTVIYILYLCCRCCCCRRPSKKPQTDRKHDTCRRRIYTSILAVIVLVNVFAVACVFITNEYTHEAAQRLPDRAERTIYDVSLYRQNTDRQIRKLLVDDYTVLNDTMVQAVKKSSSVIVARVKQVSGAESLDELSAIGERATEMTDILANFEYTLANLEKEAVKLRHNLTRLRTSAQSQLNACIQSTTNPYQEYCAQAQQALEQYNNLPERLTDLTHFAQIRDELNKVASYNVSGLLLDARRHFSDMERRFMQEIDSRSLQIEQRLNEIGDDLRRTADKISERLNSFDASKSLTLVKKYEPYLVEYEQQYRWLSGIVIGAILAVMVLCFGLGLFYGCCGKRPSYYEDDCCVRSTGAKLYCAGIFFGIVFMFVLMVVAVVLFLVGGNAHAVVCDTLERPSQRPDTISFVQRYVNVLRDTNPSFRRELADVFELMEQSNISSIIEGCNKNETLYTIFDLDEKYRLKDMKEAKAQAYRELDAQLERMIADLRVGGNLPTLLTPEIEARIEQLRDEGIPPVPERLLTQLKSRVDAFDITARTRILEEELSDNDDRELKALKKVLADVRKVDRENAEPLRLSVEQLLSNLTALNDRLPHLTEQIPNLLLVLKHAQALLGSNLTGQVHAVALQVSTQLRSYVDQYMEHVERMLETNVTSCSPLKQIGAAATDALCASTLYPFNAFWACLAVCLLLTIPTIVLATCLRDLYRNTEPYSGSDYCLSNGSTSTTPRHRRMSAFMTDTYGEHTYRRLNGSTPKRDNSCYGNWRTPSSTSTTTCFDDIGVLGSPPPPYTNKRR